MVAWVQNNKEWLFSGVGVAVVLGVLRAVLARRKAVTSAPRIKAGDASTNIQIAGDASIHTENDALHSSESSLRLATDAEVAKYDPDRERLLRAIKDQHGRGRSAARRIYFHDWFQFLVGWIGLHRPWAVVAAILLVLLAVLCWKVVSAT